MADDPLDPNLKQTSGECPVAQPEAIKKLMDEFAALGDPTSEKYRAALQKSTDAMAAMFVELGDPVSAELLREAMALQDRARQSQYCLTSTDLERLLVILQSPCDHLVLARVQAI